MRRSSRIALLVALAAVALAPAADARRTPVSTLAGSVWSDADADGRRDRGEAGRGGVTVVVERQARRRGGRVWTRVAARRTGRAGAWSATIRVAGRHRVTVRRPADAPGFAPRRADSDVGADGVKLLARVPLDGRTRHVDAGLLPPAARATLPAPDPQPPAPQPPGPSRANGIVWRDDGDGVREDRELRVEGATVEAWSADKTQLLASTRTNAFGGWELTVNATGPYRLHETSAIFPGFARPLQGSDPALDSDFLRTAADFGFTDLLAPGVDHADIGAAAVTRPQIGDFVWNDRGRDGVQDAGEPGVAGIAVELWDDGRSERYDTVVTDANGRYHLKAPGSGQSFRVHVAAPIGAVFSPKDATAEPSDSDVVSSGADAGWTDAFFLSTSVISATAWDAGLQAVP
ncbi:MAG TPA: SdrD B-like domain-containing protein [Conexibacter sp.]|jgi:hypothetical protein|nr:SdrD B-like domain-containing protein [Conexibacter sp.]